MVFMKKLIAASLSIAIFSVALSVFGKMQLTEIADKKSADKTVRVAGTIKIIDENGWFVINDENHKPINIAKVEIVKNFIRIYYTFNASTIHTFIATPDETLAANGVFLGARVTKSFATIAVSKLDNGNVRLVDASTIRSDSGNIWFHGVFSVDRHIGENL